MRRRNVSHLLRLRQILGWSQRSFHLHILSVGTRVVARCHHLPLLSRVEVCTACRPTYRVLSLPDGCVSELLSRRAYRSVSFLLPPSTCFLPCRLPSTFDCDSKRALRRLRFSWRLVPLLPPRHPSPFALRRPGIVHAHAPRGGATIDAHRSECRRGCGTTRGKEVPTL